MVELKYKKEDWVRVNDVTLGMIRKINITQFTDIDVRINGCVYTKYSKAYKEAFEKELLWAKLK